jgi:protocatechuate 3,4-dioxygenase beta subunit
MSSLTADKESPQVIGTAVVLTAVASDAENDPLQFQFSMDGQVVQDWSESPVWSWTAAAEQVGQHAIEAKVRDGKHNAEGDSASSANFEIVLPPNNAPALAGLTADSESPQLLGTTVNWTAQASDPESDPISYRFLVNDTPATDWQSENLWAWIAMQPGTSQISVQVKDSLHEGPQGEAGNMSREFSINAPVAVLAEIVPVKLNESPVLAGLTADSESPQLLGTTVTWTAQASDPESDPISYRFLVNDTPATDWQSENLWAWIAMQPGTSQISVQVKDSLHEGPQGEAGNMSREFSINAPVAVLAEIVPVKLNESPVLAGLTADSESPQLLGTTVTWTAQASDPESDPISYRFLVNDTPATDWQSENLWAWIAMQPGTSQISVQVKDSLHEGPLGEAGNMSREFSINAPAPEIKPVQEPVAAENATVPEENKTGPATTVPESVLPPVTENITIPVVAENATQQQPTNETEAVTIAPETVVPPVGDNITTPIAPENVTIPAQPANETKPLIPAAVNKTPVLNSLTADLISPQIPGTTITWTAEATDADSDTLLFRFFLSGPATSGAWQSVTEWGDAKTWTQTTSSANIGENQVKVQVRDGQHAGADGFDSEFVAFFTISQPTMNISGTAYDDKNGNGLLDSGEGLAGWTIRLAKPDNSEVSALTREDGSYRFEQLTAGSYTVSEILPSGWKAINPESGSYSVDLLKDDAADKNFANKLTSYSISGMKYNDLGGNGANDGEPGMEGWKITLSGTTQSNEAVQKELTTAKDGSYRFESLMPGTYTITETEQSGWVRTAPLEGSYSITLSDADITGKDFGNHGSWAISGSVFLDSNGNGARDADETGQAGWSIKLSQDGKAINATTSGQDGSYAFKNLAPGKYTVSEVAVEGWTVSLPQEGSYTVDLLDADVTGKDFGNKGGFTISGVKFYDANENGVQDSDEPSIPGQPVTLVQNGIEIANVTSGEDGSYTFSNLAPGTYEVDDPIIVSITVKSLIIAPIPIFGTSSISGVKWNDLNGNSVKDAGEPGIANWQMALTFVGPVGGPVHDIILAKTKTDATGAYTFRKLFPGIYKVSEFSQLGWTPTTATELTVTLPGSKTNQNFGNKLVSPPGKASIWGVKYNDINGNGANNGEPGLSGWTIKLMNLSTSVELTTTTNVNGGYSFTNLDPGSYTLSEVLQSGWTATSPAGGVYTTFALVAGDSKELNFGNRNNNLPPTVLTLTANPTSPQRVGQSIVLTATATDTENDPLQYRFVIRGPSPSSQVRSDTGYTTSASWAWSTIGSVPGDYQVEVWVRDGLHSDANGFDAKKAITYKLTVANLPPRVNVLFSDRPAPQFVGSWIRWTALASDPEGNPLQYKFYLRGPSTNGFWMDQTGWGKNNRWIWRTNPMDAGNSEVLVAVRDGNHAGPGGSDDYEIARFSIINVNLPPVITSLASNVFSPQPIGATVQWRASAMDPEGNPVFYRYWIKGPATGGFWRIARDWSTDPTWVWSTSPADAGTSEIQVQVRDGLHSSPAGWDDDAGALFTVLRPNLPPTLISLKPDKPSAQVASTPIKWTAVASDPDREPVFYKFWLTGPSTGNAWTVVQDWSTKNQWTWTSTGSDGGAYTVYVFARDGKHNPATGYDSALGAPYVLTPNQPPKLATLTPDKKSPQSAGTTVKWTATATDANKDPILYRFWLKGPTTGNAWKVVQDWSISNQWTWTNSGSDDGSYMVYVYARDGKHSPVTSYDSALGAPYQLTPNEPPKLTALVPDKISPQSAGTPVKWTATATDANKDPILYRFWLMGPTTGNAWKIVQDWSTNNQWTWTNSPIDGGSYRVFVYARDGKHAPATGYDSAIGLDYLLLNQVVSKKVVVIGRSR